MRLLLFNLVTDADDPVLGFGTRWITTLAQQVEAIDVVTMRAGRLDVPANVRVYSVGKEKGYSELRRVGEFYRLLMPLLANNRYDACFAHMMPLFAVMAAPMLWVKNIPVVLWYAHKSVTPMLRLATLVVDRIITSTRDGFRIQSPKVKMIGQGIEIERFVPTRDRSADDRLFTLLTVGRLSPIKRLELLIEAVALIRQKSPELPLCFKIVGGPLGDTDQAYAAKLHQLIAQYHLQDTVVLVGNAPFPEVVTYYQQADCFVNVSETGSIDKAVLEAMSCGVPVIVKQVFAEVLGAELAQTWVTDSAPDQVAERILLVASMPEPERRQLGEQLRAIVVRDHALEKLCGKIIAEIEDVLSKQHDT
jgi:glycosyltransferase involved in cell wall biosynthesis